MGVSEKKLPPKLTEEVFGQDSRRSRAATGRCAEADQSSSPVAPVAIHVVRSAARDIRRLDRYLADHPQQCVERRAQIAAISDRHELARLWRSTILPEFHTVSWMLSAATRSSGISFVTTRQRLQRLVGDTDANAISAGLGAHSGELASLGLLDGLEQLATGRIDRATFSTTYAHRGPHEFEIATPRPGGTGLDRSPARPARRVCELSRSDRDPERGPGLSLGTSHGEAPTDRPLDSPSATDLGHDRPQPRACAERDHPLLLGAAYVRPARRRPHRARRRRLLRQRRADRRRPRRCHAGPGADSGGASCVRGIRALPPTPR